MGRGTRPKEMKGMVQEERTGRDRKGQTSKKGKARDVLYKEKKCPD
jgi:hypothetical protein